MSLRIGLIIVLAFALFAVLPRWRYSRGWGYAPTGLFGVVLVVVVILALLKRI